jgi:drug/metabolite transporter (DMT)-like permease
MMAGLRLASRRLPAAIALLGSTAVWGSTFLVTKQSLPGTSPSSFLMWRFGIAAAVLAVVRPGRLRGLTRVEQRHGLFLGVVLGAGFLLQTTGLQRTTAGVSGFLTGSAVMLTPLVAAAFFGQPVGRAGWIAVGLSTAGIALLVLRGSSLTTSLNTGALLTVAGAGCFAVHIAALSRWATSRNAYPLTACSVGVAAVLSAAVAGAQGTLGGLPTAAAWRSVAYLAVAATCVGFVVQAWAQSALRATSAAVIMTMEPVFAAVIAVAIGGETATVAGGVGGALVVLSMFVAELGPRHCCDALSPRVECC